MAAFVVSQSADLKDKLEAMQVSIPQEHVLRLYRAISWLRCAEESANNSDVAFIALWIALNACCAVDQAGDSPLGDLEHFQRFVNQLVEQDGERKIYHCLWHEYSGHVKALIRNPYVFHEFWVAKRLGRDDWQASFDQSSLAAINALSRQRVPELFSIVLDRLFVLRNQMLFGGATYQSQVNREQVEDGTGLLASIVPSVIEVMLLAHDADWGEVAYPVINSAQSE